MATNAAESMKKRLASVFQNFSLGKRKLQRCLEDEMKDADKNEECVTTLAEGDRRFLMECFTASAAESAAQLLPVTEEIAHIKATQQSLGDRIAAMEKGVPAANLDGLKTDIMAELSTRLESMFVSRSPPPGLSSGSSQSSDLASAADPMDVTWIIGSLGRNSEVDEVLSRARQALQRAGCDEPDDIFAPYGLGSQAFCRYAESHKAAKTRMLLRKVPTKFEGENDSVWMDIKRTRAERMPKILLKDLGRGIIEIKSATDKRKVIRCGMTRRVFINKIEAAKLNNDLSITWSESCPIDARNRQELSDRLAALQSK